MQRKLRIIQAVNVRWFNATAWYGLFLSRLLKDAGHDVLVLGLEGTESFKAAERMGLSPLGMESNTINPAKFPALFRSMSSLLHEFKPDIVNCHRGEGFIFWGLLKKKFGFSLVRTRGDQRFPKGGPINRVLYNSIADAVIATNSGTKDTCIHLLGTPEEHIHTILGGVDRAVFQYSEEGRHTFRAQWGFAPNHMVLGVLGRFDHVKGQKELIEAVAQLYHTSAPTSPLRRIKLMLAGFSTTVSEQEVQHWIQENSLVDIAIITGRADNVAACISAMDVGVVASLGSEAIARAALEIMSCSVPLVSTRIGVMPDLLPDWAMAEAGDIPALAALLQKALLDAGWRDTLRTVCTQRMVDLDAATFLQHTLAVYNSVLRK